MIGKMDETAMWLDMPGEYSLETVGNKTVTMNTTGHEKMRVRVCLTAMANSTKLPRLVLLKGVKPPKDIPTGLHGKMTPGAWANGEVIRFRIKMIWRKVCKANRGLLVWDSFSGHRTAEVKKMLCKYSTNFAVIPGWYTSKHQPCDVNLNKY